MKLITETKFEDVQLITEEAEGKKSLFIEGIFLQSAIKNRNGRIYPEGIMEREVTRYTKDLISEDRAYGELNHPKGPTINLDRVSHRIVSLTKEGTNWIGKAKIMTNTPMGAITKGIMEDGGRLGVSSRGLGTVKTNKAGIMEVQDDFHLATAADIVSDPSAPDAFVNGIMENCEWVWNGGILSPQQIEEIQEEVHETSKADLEEKTIQIWEKFIKSLI